MQETQALPLKDRENESTYRAPRVQLKMSDFNILGRVGDGSFSFVILAEHRGSGKKYAIKIMNKHLIMRNKMVEYIKNERNILDKLDNDGVVKLYFTFQDADSLYMGLEHCAGGELYEQIQKKGKLPVDTARFYAAEIVLILEYLRLKQIIHRDLKPENLLLDGHGHLKLIDLGSAKALFLLEEQPVEVSKLPKARACSFVGTAEYVSPEVLENLPVSYPADLWALGCILYHMLAGQPPFKGGSEYLTFQKVTDRDFHFPDDFPDMARDLVDRLLQSDPSQRIGAQDFEELKQHTFFEGIDWQNLRSSAAPDFVPPTPPSAEDEAVDWELMSLVRDHMQPQPAGS